ncbi:MAG: hypothetical protein HYY00_00035 [Chloroflexi bacterium]|nr:hypothetical protein [Chloroflexota bacterium]
MTLQMGWFSTGRGEGSRGLLRLAQESILAGELDARIQFVFCNREPGEHEGSDRYFELVRGYGLPLVTVSSRQFRRAVGGDFASHREEYDRRVMERIARFSPDVIVLAGYMLIVSGVLCRRYVMLNLHPALPGGPAGTWQEVIWQLIEQRASEQGAMVHLVTEAVDQGPPITCFSFPLRGEPFDGLWRAVEGVPVAELKRTQGEECPLFQAIRREGVRRETHLLLETLKALANRRVRVEGGRVLDERGREVRGRCLNDEIEAKLRGGRQTGGEGSAGGW